MDKFTTKSFEETQKIGIEFAKHVLSMDVQKTALVLALSGDLGAGKTKFLQGFAQGLGIEEIVNSPTFVIMKRFGNFYHIDCYRLEKPEEIVELGFQEIISNPENIVAIEWPEKIAGILPKNAVKINFKHLEENKREIMIQ